METQVQRDRGSHEALPTACVADVDMRALIDSGATDHTVGRMALTKAQLKQSYKIPVQMYNMATGTVKVDEAVDSFVPALGCVLDFRLIPGGDRPLFYLR